MNHQTSEDLQHDRINLLRLVRRLEKTVASPEWQTSASPSAKSPWLKTQGMLQNVKHARKLLRNVELQDDFDVPTATTSSFGDIHRLLDRLEHTVSDFDQRVTSKRARPTPILPTLPLPVSKPISSPPCSPKHSTEPVLLSLDPNTSLSAQDLLLSPSESVNVSTIDVLNPPPTLPAPMTAPSPPTVSNVKGTPAFYQNSSAIHDELSEQLAQMATQLKRNAIHFAGSLEKDKAVVLETQEKLERNFDVLSNERVRLRDHRTKSWGTTWITVLSIVVAMIGFILTFFVIRFT